MSAQVVGTDRTYGFPRICDQSPSVRIFPEEHKKVRFYAASRELNSKFSLAYNFEGSNLSCRWFYTKIVN